MPSRILIFVFLCAAVIPPVKRKTRQCESSRAPGWSDELCQLYPDCSNTVPSPNGLALFQIGPVEQMRILKGGRSLALIGNPKLALPAVISWSPNSTGFFLNDGNGSGLSSQLRLFRIAGTVIKEDDKANRNMIRIYRGRNKCNSASDNPNVYGVGWSTDGKAFYAIAQSTVNAPCGKATKFLGFIVDFGNGVVKQVLSTQQTKSEFDRFLPQELR